MHGVGFRALQTKPNHQISECWCLEVSFADNSFIVLRMSRKELAPSKQYRKSDRAGSPGIRSARLKSRLDKTSVLGPESSVAISQQFFQASSQIGWSRLT